MADDIKQFSEEIKKHFNEKTEEIKQHMDVVAEDLKGQIQQVAEGVETNTQQLERIETRLTNLEPVRDDVKAIKVTVQGIKHDLKQKVDREEFVEVERRVGSLEPKLHPA